MSTTSSLFNTGITGVVKPGSVTTDAIYRWAYGTTTSQMPIGYAPTKTEGRINDVCRAALASIADHEAKRIKKEIEFMVMTGMNVDKAISVVSEALGARVLSIEIDPWMDNVVINTSVKGLHKLLGECAKLTPQKVLKPKKPEGGTVVFWADGTKSHAEPHDGDEYRPLMGELVIAAKRVMSDPLKDWEPMLHAIVDWLGERDTRKKADALRTLSKFALVAADIIDVEAEQQETEERVRKEAEKAAEAERKLSLLKERAQKMAERDVRIARAVAKALED